MRVSMGMTKTALAAFLALPVLLEPALAVKPNRPTRTDESCRPRYGTRDTISWGLSGSNTCWIRSGGPRTCTPSLRIYPDKFSREREYIRLSCLVWPLRYANPVPQVEFNFLPIRDIRSMPRKVRKWPFGKKMPLRVGLWSWAEDGGRKTLLHDVEHYRRTHNDAAWGLPVPTIREEEAVALIRKLHRADYMGWTMDKTGESSELAVIDERLREQIDILMKVCGIDPGPAPRTPPAAPRITRNESPNKALQPQALRQKP